MYRWGQQGLALTHFALLHSPDFPQIKYVNARPDPLHVLCTVTPSSLLEALSQLKCISLDETARVSKFLGGEGGPASATST